LLDVTIWAFASIIVFAALANLTTETIRGAVNINEHVESVTSYSQMDYYLHKDISKGSDITETEHSVIINGITYNFTDTRVMRKGETIYPNELDYNVRKNKIGIRYPDARKIYRVY